MLGYKGNQGSHYSQLKNEWPNEGPAVCGQTGVGGGGRPLS